MYPNKNIHTNIPKYLLSIKICVYMCVWTLVFVHTTQLTNQRHIKCGYVWIIELWFTLENVCMLIKYSIMNMCYFLNQEIEKLWLKSYQQKVASTCRVLLDAKSSNKLFKWDVNITSVVILKYIHSVSDTPSCRRYSLIFLALPMGGTQWLSSKEQRKAERTARNFGD